MTGASRRTAGSGLPRTLAASRSQQIGAVAYTLELAIPEAAGAPVEGRVAIDIGLAPGEWPPLDFAPGPDDDHSRRSIRRLEVDGRAVPFGVSDGRLAVQAGAATAGSHRIVIDFVAGGAGLVRRDELVYTLFVPDRAHTVFPCFDQPDLKASLQLALELPAAWDVLANAPEISRGVSDGRLGVRFAGTEPLPTYLFAFAAGRLRREHHERNGRRIVLLGPPEAAPALELHRAAILELKTRALELIEEYTNAAQPFAQTGLVLIPDFEFSGMEHPGAVFYRQDELLLPATADPAAAMRRAALIAHETAHLWFGDLVTMPWFDEVWLKEVCANFMADKIVAGIFPASDHATAFMLRHFPPAWDIDRTPGTHPIAQPLESLGEAAQLYDALIYHKAPIAFAALEREIGESAMRAALARYIDDFRFGNAGWPELRERLEAASGQDLSNFSRTWIEAAGRPMTVTDFEPGMALPYAAFAFDDAGRARALAALTGAASPRERARAWLSLHEDMLDGGIAPALLLTEGLRLLGTETDALLLARLLDDLGGIYWRFLSEAHRAYAAGPAERVLRLKAGPAMDAYWLRCLARFALGEETIAAIEAVWRGRDGNPAGDESIDIDLALELALRRPERAIDLLTTQLGRTTDPERRRRLEFIAPALSTEHADRERLFKRLLASHDRGRWALAALGLLCHPLRAAEALDYLEPGIAHARERFARSDVFFPRQWLTTLFSGQGTADAATAIDRLIAEAAPEPRFHALLLQTADPVFRAARIRAGHPPLRSGT